MLPALGDGTFAVRVTLPSCSAHALATVVRGTSVPGIVAQPPFSIYGPCSHVEAFFNSVSLVAASACARNFAIQKGVSAVMTAVSVRAHLMSVTVV